MSTNFENLEEKIENIEEKYFENLEKGMIAKNGIHVNPVLLRALGFNFPQAIILSQYEYISAGKNGKAFLYQDKNFLYSVGSVDKIMRAKKALKEKGLISVEVKGLPARSYIVFNHEAVEKLKKQHIVDAYFSIPEYLRPGYDEKTQNQVYGLSINCSMDNPQTTNKEIYKEIIKENTKRNPASGSPSSPKVDELRLAEEIFYNRFWVLVPNKVNIAKAKNRFFQITNKCKNEKKVNEVIEGYKRYIAYIENEHKKNKFQRRYQDPSTFLNVKEEKWLDPWEFVEEEPAKKETTPQTQQPKDVERRIRIARKLKLLDNFLPDEYDREWKFIPKEVKEILISKDVENYIKDIKTSEETLITQIACVTMIGKDGYMTWKDKYEEETGERPIYDLEFYIPFGKKLPGDIWKWLLKYSHNFGLPSERKIDEARQWYYKSDHSAAWNLFA